MFSTKEQALQWRIRKRNMLLAKLERLLREINTLEKEIELIHGSNHVYEHLYGSKKAET